MTAPAGPVRGYAIRLLARYVAVVATMALTTGGAAGQSSCGNGHVDAGEQCDDGNSVDGDCCSSTCQFEPFDSPCNDHNPCTAGDRCTGTGLCWFDSCHTGTGCICGAQCTGNNGGCTCGGPGPCTVGQSCGKCGSGSCIYLCGEQDTACISNSSHGCDTDQDCAPGDVCVSLRMGDYCGGGCVTPCR